MYMIAFNIFLRLLFQSYHPRYGFYCILRRFSDTNFFPLGRGAHHLLSWLRHFIHLHMTRYIFIYTVNLKLSLLGANLSFRFLRGGVFEGRAYSGRRKKLFLLFTMFKSFYQINYFL